MDRYQVLILFLLTLGVSVLLVNGELAIVPGKFRLMISDEAATMDIVMRNITVNTVDRCGKQCTAEGVSCVGFSHYNNTCHLHNTAFTSTVNHQPVMGAKFYDRITVTGVNDAEFMAIHS